MLEVNQASIALRTYVYIDSLQPQLAEYMATVSQGFLPVPGDACLWIEVSPGMAVHRLTDMALKATRVHLAQQVVERAFSSLRAAPQRVGNPNLPVPYSPVLEAAVLISVLVAFSLHLRLGARWLLWSLPAAAWVTAPTSARANLASAAARSTSGRCSTRATPCSRSGMPARRAGGPSPS